MSDLFRGNKKYYDFIRAMEVENNYLRQMNAEYSAKTVKCNTDFQTVDSKTKHALQRIEPRKLRDRTTARETYKKKDPFIDTHPSQKKSKSYFDTPPAKDISHKWPVRANSAQRILSPAKLREASDGRPYQEAPLIHNTGIMLTTPKPRNGMKPPSTPASRLTIRAEE